MLISQLREEGFSVKLIYITGILLTLLAFDGPRRFALNLCGYAHSGAQTQPARTTQPARKHPRDLTVPRQFRGYNGPRDA